MKAIWKTIPQTVKKQIVTGMVFISFMVTYMTYLISGLRIMLEEWLLIYIPVGWFEMKAIQETMGQVFMAVITIVFRLFLEKLGEMVKLILSSHSMMPKTTKSMIIHYLGRMKAIEETIKMTIWPLFRG